MRLSYLSATVTSILLFSTPAWAHPGPLDACSGHVAEERVEYPPMADGRATVPSESQEYHIHWNPEQIEQAQRSLREYFATPREIGDHGSVIVDGVQYDILEYTRQSEAIFKCESERLEAGKIKTGIVRVRLEQ